MTNVVERAVLGKDRIHEDIVRQIALNEHKILPWSKGEKPL
jgi:hypothetical protein